ncbi:hypothetical protein CF327_g4116 [Tilletia walkeri]|nr:hypothetical protein CF327_g4116 [Tilletia walkeri]
MGLIIVLLRWTHLLLSLRAAHKAISHGRRPEARQPAYPNGRMNNPNARRARPARRKEQDRADVLRSILTRFFVWMLYRRAEGILDGLGQWILFYDTAKTLFLFWLLVSHDFAASQLFHSVLEPLVHPYEPLLDAVATRVVRSLHGLNFLSLLFFTHLSQRIPPTLSQGTKSAFERIRTSIVWLETKLAERRAQAIEVHELDGSVDGRSRSGSPPPFFVPPSRAASNNPYATLPGSWRPLHSPAITSRPGLPDTWGAGASSSRAGPSSLPTRRVVSNGNGNGDMPSSSRTRTNGRAHATYSARALSKLPQPPTNEPSPSVPRVRLMPDWPASPHASSSNLAAAAAAAAPDAHEDGLGRPPSPPAQLSRVYGLSSNSGLSAQQGPSSSEPTKKTSSSPKTTPRKRKKRESLEEEGYLEEEEPAKKPRGKGSAASKARSPKGASKSGTSARTVKSHIPVTVKGKQRQRVVEIQDEDDDEDSGGSSEVVEPAPKRTRTKTKGEEKEKEEVGELPPSYSTRTLRARPNRDSSSTTPSIASPPPTTATTEARTTTTTTTVKMASKKKQGKPASPAKIDGEKKKKKMSSTSTGARTRGLGRVDGPGVSAAAVTEVNEKGSSSGSRGTVRLSRRT